MKFKIPDSVLYLVIGINVVLFVLGAALDRWDLSILAIISTMLCLSPLMLKDDKE
jgi:hypothetical protein